MDARKVAAQFAAYTWYENTQTYKQSAEKKARFARENWIEFLWIAPKGLGELLIRLAAHHPSQRRKRVRSEELATTG